MRNAFICALCNVKITDYAQVGYDGPAYNGKPNPNNKECSPLMDWMVLCQPCAKKLDVEQGDSEPDVSSPTGFKWRWKPI